MIGEEMIGKYVVVRTYSAGVHCGVFKARDGREVQLADARRIWRWYGANTLSEIATSGLDQTQSRVSVPVADIVLTEAIEIIPCTEAGEQSLRGAKWTR